MDQYNKKSSRRSIKLKTLLLNGCSFGKCWTPTKQFISSLGCDTHVNISKIATSFQRTCRSTIEWIAQNGDPDYVIIPITYVARIEMPAARCDKWNNIDGNWIPVQEDGTLPNDSHELRRKIVMHVDQNLLASYYKQYHKLVYSSIGYIDKVLTEIIMLSSFLKSRNIPYLMFDMCNDFDEDTIYKHPHTNKIKLIKSDERIIDIFNFCGNKFMQESLESGVADFNVHHKPEQYLVLEAHLQQYIKQNNIIE